MDQKHRRNFLVYITLTFLSGTACATFLPVMSVFLKDSVGATPLQIGSYFTLTAIAGIVVTQVLAKFSDGKISRKLLIVLGGLGGALAGLVFILSGVASSYWLIVTLGVFCLSFSGLSTPQVFASAREYSIARSGKSVMFTMYMRAFFALAWVVAPPLAYITATRFGFVTLFSFTVVFFVLIALIAALWLPKTTLGGISNSMSTEAKSNEDKTLDDNEKISSNDTSEATQNNVNAKTSNNFDKLDQTPSIFDGGFKVWKDVVLLFIAVTLMWTCNNAYLISMPIFVRDELGISKELPGIMMASAALMEIPIMLLAGKLSSSLGIKNIQLVSALGGVLFYLTFLLMPHDTIWCFLAVQFFNSVFIGILAGMGMVYFQELLPKIPGQATTLFSNAANTGAIVSGMMVGVITSIGTYGHAFLICLMLASMALVLVFFVRKV